MKTILHLEDEERVTQLVRLILGNEYNYIVVSSVKDALDIINFRKINLILLDLRLLVEKKTGGELEGEKLLQALQETKKKIKVILLTGLSETARIVMKKYPKLVKGIIDKPFRINALREIIKNVLSSKM